MTIKIGDSTPNDYDFMGPALVSIVKDNGGTIAMDHGNSHVKNKPLLAGNAAHDQGVFLDDNIRVDDSTVHYKPWQRLTPIRVRIKKKTLPPRSVNRVSTISPFAVNPNASNDLSPFSFPSTNPTPDPTAIIAGFGPGYNTWTLSRGLTSTTGGASGFDGTYTFHYEIHAQAGILTGAIVGGIAVGLPTTLTATQTAFYTILSGTPLGLISWGLVNLNVEYIVTITP